MPEFTRPVFLMTPQQRRQRGDLEGEAAKPDAEKIETRPEEIVTATIASGSNRMKITLGALLLAAGIGAGMIAQGYGEMKKNEAQKRAVPARRESPPARP